jgi:TolB-like protein/Tfp pilus assembly protein PilF
MADLPRRISAFFGELKRRHVIQVGIGYAAVAFVLIEAANNILPVLGVSEAWVRFVVVLGLLGFPVAVTLAWIFDIKAGGVVKTEPLLGAGTNESWRRVSNETRFEARALDPKTLAVLPFDNIGGNQEDDYFSDGITDELIANLSRIQDLKVVSRTSVMVYKHEKTNVRRIGLDLGAGSVVEGSVRRSDGRVRIVAQLIDARTDEHLWADKYDRSLEDIFAIQSDVAESIATALQAELSPSVVARIERPATVDMEAYDRYLKGRFLTNLRTEDGLRSGIELLEEAIGRDPLYSLAYAGLADSFLLLGLYNAERPELVMPRAKTAAQKALSLDPRLGEALTSLACIHSIYDWDWATAEVEFRRAILANPRYPTAHQWFAMNHLAPRGRFEEAHRELHLAQDLDPLSPVLEVSRAFLLFLEDRQDEAELVLRRLLSADPGFVIAHQFLGNVLDRQGRHDEAIDAYRSVEAVRGRATDIVTALGEAYARAGRLDEARAARDELIAASEERYVSPGRIGQVYLALGELEQAFEWLHRAVDVRAVDLIWLQVMPHHHHLRGDARFDELLARVGLADE